MPLTDAKKRANKKYQAKTIASLACRVKKDQAEAFKTYCGMQGRTSNAVIRDYVLSCIEERDSGGNPSESPCEGLEGPQGVGVVTLPSDTFEAAQRAADAAGESVGDFMRRAVDAQAQRDEVTRRLKI